MKYYLLEFRGQGDTSCCIVDETVWDWIFSNDADALPPDTVKLAVSEFEELEDILDSSPGNDRALLIASLDLYGKSYHLYSGEEECADAVECWKKELDIEDFEDSFHGYIY